MNLFYSNVKMTRYLKKLKKSNDIATVLGLDIGRVFVGTSISDRFLTKTKPLKTFELQSGHFFKFYPTHQDEFNLNLEFFYGLNKLIKDNKVKGLVIGYPLVNNQPCRHSHFIEDFVKHMCREEILKVPLTFVNEEFSTIQASKFIEIYEITNNDNMDKKLSQRKRLQDKVAASIILQRFLKNYNSDQTEGEEGQDES